MNCALNPIITNPEWRGDGGGGCGAVPGTDPANAVVARVPAGCSPVRMSISPKGDRIYVTARNSTALLEFDTSKLVSDGAHAMVGMAPVGDAPVPVMVVDGGKRLVVGNSNRFGGRGTPEYLAVLDAAKIREGLHAVEGVIPSGSFPREMAVSSDGRTLFLTNFASNSLQVMDIAHLPIDSKLPPEFARNADTLAHRHEYKPITVDPVVLRRYIGVYQTDTGIQAIIDVNGNQLTAKLGSSSEANAVPESDTKFFLLGAEIEFPKAAEGGNAAQLTLYQGPRGTVFKRLDGEGAQRALDAAAAFAKRVKDNQPLSGSEAAVRKLISDVQAGKLDGSMFAPGGQQLLPQLQRQVSALGKVKAIAFQAVGPAGPDIYTVESEKGSWAFRIWLADDGKVERANITERPK